MKIPLWGINFAPELTGIVKYTGELTAWLVDEQILLLPQLALLAVALATLLFTASFDW